MGYPSIIYLENENKKPLAISVFEDLQLLNFMTADTVAPALIPCTGQNISARQELFKALENAQNKMKLSELYGIAVQLEEYGGLYAYAKTDEEKKVAFAGFTILFCKFSELAAVFSCGDPLTQRFSSYFKELINSSLFSSVKEKSAQLTWDKISGFLLKLHDSTVKIGSNEGKSYIEKLLQCAEKLRLNNITLRNYPEKSLSPEIISAICLRNREVFSEFEKFHNEFSGNIDFSVTDYCRQLKFCITMSELLKKISDAGIPLCYPEISRQRIINVKDAYDVSLLAKNTVNIVPNDICFTDDEPFWFLTGANGGGKTTYLRTIGITAVMYLLGCPVPARSALIGGIDRVCTHFPRDERFDGSGRFVEENRRVDEITESMDSGTLVLLNETYSAADEEKAVMMTGRLAAHLRDNAIFGLYITHQHSLPELNIPYLNVSVDRNNKNMRTYKIVRRKESDGSFAEDILKKYGLTDEALKERFGKL